MRLDKNDIVMLTDNPRDFFKQPALIQEGIDDLLEKIARYRSASTAINCKQGDGTGVFGGYSSSKTEECVVNIVELEEMIAARKRLKSIAIQKICYVLSSMIDDSFDIDIMLDYYIKHMKWKVIAKKYHKSVYTLYAHQEKVFKEISQKLCTFT